MLYLQNLNDHAKAKKILTAANTAYFTYTPKSQKPHTYLLKGLGNSYTEAEILEDLKALKIEEVNFTKVSRFSTRKSRENNILLPIHIIQVSPDSNIGNLLKINRLNYLKIAWEKIKKNDITQCYKCQRIGHTAQNCNLNYRCVFFFFYLFIKIHNLSNLDIWWNFLTVKLACWWLPPAGYHPRVS